MAHDSGSQQVRVLVGGRAACPEFHSCDSISRYLLLYSSRRVARRRHATLILNQISFAAVAVQFKDGRARAYVLLSEIETLCYQYFIYTLCGESNTVVVLFIYLMKY
jgi:hypothetical protein